jgi:hypothetical protein
MRWTTRRCQFQGLRCRGKRQAAAGSCRGRGCSSRDPGTGRRCSTCSGRSEGSRGPHFQARVPRCLQGTRILWVDDRPNNKRFERKALEALGIEVTSEKLASTNLRQELISMVTVTLPTRPREAPP